MRNTLFWLLVMWGSAALVSGCAVARQTRALPGDNPRLTQAGATRAEVEQALGPPLRSWSPSAQVSYQLHAFRAPLPGSKSEAAALLFMDVLTLGMEEAIQAMAPQQAFTRDPFQTYALLWFGFDAQDRLCGIYAEYAVLPATPGTPPSSHDTPSR